MNPLLTLGFLCFMYGMSSSSSAALSRLAAMTWEPLAASSTTKRLSLDATCARIE